MLKKIILLLTCIIFATSLSVAVLADENEDNLNNNELKVYVSNESQEVETALLEKFDNLFNMLNINLARDGYDIEDVTIGHAFNIQNTERYIFPVIKDDKIIRMIQMEKNEDDGKYYAEIGDFGVEGLNSLDDSKIYYIVADENDNNLYAVSGSDVYDVLIADEAENDKDNLNLISTLSNDDSVNAKET